MVWRALVANSDGYIVLSNTKLGNGVFSRATENTEFWIYVVGFASLGVICISICILILIDVIRNKQTLVGAAQAENHSAS
jgi:hypothetical protein